MGARKALATRLRVDAFVSDGNSVYAVLVGCGVMFR